MGYGGQTMQSKVWRGHTGRRWLGAKEEGIFRNHMITASGRVRDTVWFSIIDSEWPQVRLELERKLVRSDT